MSSPEFAPIESLTYAQSVGELEKILRTMQSDQCDIDHLAAYTARAAELLRACRSRLTSTEQELAAILQNVQL